MHLNLSRAINLQHVYEEIIIACHEPAKRIPCVQKLTCMGHVPPELTEEFFKVRPFIPSI